jgi:LysR family transcriptional regulator, transcriptional activator for bauABCD operon
MSKVPGSERQELTPSAEALAVTGQRFARNLDWNLLRMFHEITQAGGISHAAHAIGRKQPALSMALRRLEELVGGRLCHRGPGGFALTRQGELLAEICETIFGAVTRIPSMVDATDEVRGRIRLQMISNLVEARIDRAIQAFHHDYPTVEIFVSIAPRALSELSESRGIPESAEV